ncbi:MAG TPA: ACP phosphodiesterase [Thermoanaerobaculia bacterium]|nr:ACP phosphodiesterase [Thermoanaerobaculia bacterium]
MNHLAHLVLADPTTDSLIGNLSGDFVKGPLGDRFPPAIRDGIMQHRRIDAFTDSHPAAAAFRRVLAAEHGHYARVIADMFFDHFLAAGFERYAGEPLERFLARTFAALDPHADAFPGRLRAIYPRMRDEGWLVSYREIDGIRFALSRMSWRFSRRPELASATHFLVDAREELERLFADLWRDLRNAGFQPAGPPISDRR